MKAGISLSINVTEIEKARLIEGKKGKYLNATVFVDLDNADQYGNHGMITQDVSKEERDAGTRGAILGNAKVFWQGVSNSQTGNSAPTQQKQSQPAPQQGFDDFSDSDIPF